MQKSLEQLKVTGEHLKTRAAAAKGAHADFYQKLIDATNKQIEGLKGRNPIPDAKKQAANGEPKKNKPAGDGLNDEMGILTHWFD